MEHSVTIMLQHTSVRVEAGIVQFGDLLSEKLDAISGIAKDDRLIDLESREEGVEAMDLLAFVDIAVVLRNTSERQLVH